jgi:hypothetical protein
MSFIVDPRIKPESFDVKEKARYFYSVYLRHLVLYHKISERNLINVIEVSPKLLQVKQGGYSDQGCHQVKNILGWEPKTKFEKLMKLMAKAKFNKFFTN